MKFDDLVRKLNEDFISPFNGSYKQVAAAGGQSGGTTTGDHEKTFPNNSTGMLPIPNNLFPKINYNKKFKKRKKITQKKKED